MRGGMATVEEPWWCLQVEKNTLRVVADCALGPLSRSFTSMPGHTVNWFIAGAVSGMLIIFTYRKEGTLSARYARLGPTRLLLFGAALGAVIFGLPPWLCSTILDALSR
jgi:hypothetical protein